MKRLLVVLLMALVLVGCAPAESVTTKVAMAAEEVVAVTEEVVAEQPVEIADLSIRLGQVEEAQVAIGDPEVVIEEAEVEKTMQPVIEKPRLMYQPPPPSLYPEFLFYSAGLDVSLSTPEEIVIQMLYFGEDGEPLSWEESEDRFVWGWVKVRIWPGTPTASERAESLSGGGYLEAEFHIASSNDVMVIPTSALDPSDGDKVTVVLSLMKDLWGFNPPETWFPDNSRYDVAFWPAVLEKTW